MENETNKYQKMTSQQYNRNLNYLWGSLFIGVGIWNLFSPYFFASIFFIVAGCIILPVTRQFIEKHIKYQFSSFTRHSIVIVSVLIAASSILNSQNSIKKEKLIQEQELNQLSEKLFQGERYLTKAITNYDLPENEYLEFLDSSYTLFKMIPENYDGYKDAQESLLFIDSLHKNNASIIELRKIKHQEEIQKLKEYEKEREKEIIKKAKLGGQLEKKYKKMFEGSGWLHEKQNKLARMDFIQYKSGYEPTPGGTDELAFYYKKIEDGFVIHVMLQYHYSLEHHYAKVWLTEE